MMKNAVSFLVEKTSHNVKTAVSRTRTQAILYGVLAAAAFMLLLFVCFAFFFSLATYFSPLQAAWIIAGLWLVVCLVTWGVIRYISQQRKEAAILPTMPKDQRQLLTSSAVTALFWVARRSPTLKYAASFAGILGLMQIIKGIDEYGDCKPPRRPSNLH